MVHRLIVQKSNPLQFTKNTRKYVYGIREAPGLTGGRGGRFMLRQGDARASIDMLTSIAAAMQARDAAARGLAARGLTAAG